MCPKRTLTYALPVLLLLLFATSVRAADPGRPSSRISDQKPGSVLIFNIYTSSPSNPVLQNTRLNITNTDDERGIAVHLFFVDGDSCAVADSFVCLSKSQTVSLLASEIDPGVNGYAIAIASDSYGRPIAFDRLIGSTWVRFATGHTASLGAEAVASPQGRIVMHPVPGADESAVVLLFDDVSLERLPRVLAVDNIQSRLDGNDTLLIVNRIGGDLRTSAAPIDKLFTILFDEIEISYSSTIFNLGCQVRRSLNNEFPRTVPRFNSVLFPGMSGWLKFWASTDTVDPVVGQTTKALLGAAINYNPNADMNAAFFNQGRNLHKLTTGDTTALVVPVFPPNCPAGN